MILASPTKAELALQVLRERILSGELVPGHRLRIQDLTDEFQMSSTPIREALRLLQADRLVEYHPHQGVVVATLRSDSVEEIYRLRVLLEPLVVELAVATMSEQRLALLEDSHRQLTEAAEMGRAAKLAELNRLWHWAVYESAQAPLCVDFVRQLWDAFPWRTIWSVPGRAEIAVKEHEAVMVAVRAGDEVTAAETMRRHIVGSQRLMIAGVGTRLSEWSDDEAPEAKAESES